MRTEKSVFFFKYRGVGAGGGGSGRAGSAGAGLVGASIGCVSLWDLKHGSEQLKPSAGYNDISNSVVDKLWERTSRTLVFFRFCVTDTAESVCHCTVEQYRTGLMRDYNEKVAVCVNEIKAWNVEHMLHEVPKLVSKLVPKWPIPAAKIYGSSLHRPMSYLPHHPICQLQHRYVHMHRVYSSLGHALHAPGRLHAYHAPAIPLSLRGDV